MRSPTQLQSARESQRRYKQLHPDKYTLNRIRQHERKCMEWPVAKRKRQCRVWYFWGLQHLPYLIKRPKVCSKCGSKCKPNGHHPNYRFPLRVRWLCSKCHRKLHQMKGVKRMASTMKKGLDWTLIHRQVKYLLKKGLNQCQIARQLGINNSTVCKIASGKQKPRRSNAAFEADREQRYHDWLSSQT